MQDLTVLLLVPSSGGCHNLVAAEKKRMEIQPFWTQNQIAKCRTGEIKYKKLINMQKYWKWFSFGCRPSQRYKILFS